MVFKLTSRVRTPYGEADYTIMDALLSQEGYLFVRKDWYTNWKKVYYYHLKDCCDMRVDGRQVKSFARENGIEILGVS